MDSKRPLPRWLPWLRWTPACGFVDWAMWLIKNVLWHLFGAHLPTCMPETASRDHTNKPWRVWDGGAKESSPPDIVTIFSPQPTDLFWGASHKWNRGSFWVNPRPDKGLMLLRVDICVNKSLLPDPPTKDPPRWPAGEFPPGTAIQVGGGGGCPPPQWPSWGTSTAGSPTSSWSWLCSRRFSPCSNTFVQAAGRRRHLGLYTHAEWWNWILAIFLPKYCFQIFQ